MDRQDNESLHQKASEHYLQGEYSAALELWRTLHHQAPDDERAAEGIRLCEMMSEGRADPEPEVAAGFDLAPEEEDPGFDLDTSLLDEMPEPEKPDGSQAVEDAVEQVLLDLDQLPETDGAPPPPSESPLDAAAAAELLKRQSQLLDEARAAREDGRLDDATGLLARLFILNENHEDARALEAEILEQTSKAAFEVEDKIAEAVQWMESGRLEDAESNLRRVLDISPGHQEADHYLDQVLRRMEEADGAEDPPEPESLDSTMDHGAVNLDTGGAEEIALGKVELGIGQPDDPAVKHPVGEVEFGASTEEPGEAQPARSGLLNLRNLILAAAVLILAAAGWYFGRDLVGGGSSTAEDEAGSAFADSSSPASEAAVERSTDELIQQADALSRSAEDVSRADAEQIPGLVEQASRQMEEADYASAVITWNQVLEVDPGHTGARRGIEEAGRRYREYKERSADLARAGYIFDEGEYSSALKILYRLPEDIQPEKVRLHKVNGWYNLAVISLKAGRIDQALERCGEIALLEVDDPGAAELQAFAESYREREKDRAYYQDVNELAFRTFDGS
jgi:tetratricopeptide (TPR) repeat protein